MTARRDIVKPGPLPSSTPTPQPTRMPFGVATGRRTRSVSGQRRAMSTSGTTARPFRYGDDWWRRGVVYQIYPRSFADRDGDGTGDLPGITEHLPYLGPDGLGVDAIWLSPIYPSPGRDIGYDVSDHTAVDPLFG